MVYTGWKNSVQPSNSSIVAKICPAPSHSRTPSQRPLKMRCVNPSLGKLCACGSDIRRLKKITNKHSPPISQFLCTTNPRLGVTTETVNIISLAKTCTLSCTHCNTHSHTFLKALTNITHVNTNLKINTRYWRVVVFLNGRNR